MRRAFTLIESLIAVALGLTVCSVAYACLRASSQAVATANQLSTENRMLRAGYLAALEEADFWTVDDDPTDATHQPLRGDGHPFHRLAFAGDLALTTDQSLPDAAWRGLPTRDDDQIAHYGRYDLAASTAATAPHRHQAVLLRDAYAHLGFCGAFEYAAPNAIFSFMDDGGAVPATWWRYQLAPGFLDANDSMPRPGDFIQVTQGGAFVVTRQPASLAADVDHARYSFWAWGPSGQPPWDYAGFSAAADPVALLPARPAAWPEVTVTVRRLVAMFRKTTSASVVLTSPVTGETMKIAWTVAGTTLRGARRQRDAALGWARTGFPTLDD